MNVSEILSKAADLIEPEGAWTQGSAARDANGHEIDPQSREAACWCVYGALDRVAGDRFQRGIGFIEEATGQVLISVWNDAPERTQAEVVAKLREAAELARTGAA